MCGIFGLVVSDESNLNSIGFEQAIRLQVKLSEPRGREASGLAIASKDRIAIYKQASRPSEMLRSRGFAEFLRSSLNPALSNGGSGDLTKPVAAIGHCRLVTNGSQAIQDNNQPISINHVVGVHNGIVTNDQELFKLYPDVRKHSGISESDSEVLFGLINKYYEESRDLITAISKTYREIVGSASIALFSDSLSLLALATNTGSLYYSYQKDRGFFVFGSERYIIDRFLRKSGLLEKEDSPVVYHLKPSTGLVIPFDDLEPRIISLRENPDRPIEGRVFGESKLYKIIDEGLPKLSLRRCSKCVLPETYPFIFFDEKGVCNYCLKYKKQEPLGREALEAVLEKYRSEDGRPDCIAGLSGGRDSTYGLHILKTEFRMNPIAYTYDWALVTDLARRNQAKVTGKLGVEHIIRAADIHTKRRYVRKNIYAWLKKPELGMVPLFMAGDKMFYYYGRQLRRETGIGLTVFCAGHQVEQMEFKVGFCGIDQHLTNNTKLYHFNWMNKIRLAMLYSKQYVTNPGYINESLFDSIFAFYSSFINKDDYLYLYRYIPWDEKSIERTLKKEYDWETDEKYGKNQWRMGDGQTAFIDYIYYTVAGFSEFDNFRSNQIREGLLSREEALELLKGDNKPRLRMLQDFSLLIGFNLEEVLMKINRIPKLYETRKFAAR